MSDVDADDMPILPPRQIGDVVFEQLVDLAKVLDDPIRRATESPIEAMLATALVEALPEGTKIEPQALIGPYRADFLIDGWLVVECDGLEFHSSPEQIANDTRRSDWLEGQGYRVQRFSGKEIYHQVGGCASRIYTAFILDAPDRRPERG